MKRSRNLSGPAVALGLLIAAPVHAGQPQAGVDAASNWEAMATTDLADSAGGSRSLDLGVVLDDIQLNASNTTATVTGNTISGLNTGAAFNNSMSDIHGFGNTMVVNTGVLTMSNSVNVNVSLDMSR